MTTHPFENLDPTGRPATWFGRRSWVVFTTYPDGIDVVDLGWAG